MCVWQDLDSIQAVFSHNNNNNCFARRNYVVQVGNYENEMHVSSFKTIIFHDILVPFMKVTLL